MSAGSLIGPLSISGSNTNTGTPNAGGSFFAYIVGTTTQTPIYSDAAATIAVTQPIVLDNAGRIPYATYPNGLYCVGPIRLYVLASDGTTVISDTVYQTVASTAALSNADFPSEATVDAAFTAIGTSVGGIDGKYQAPGGNTPRTIQAAISSLQLTPQDFGALGDGLHDDTAAIQAAINRVISLGGGIVYLPATSAYYKISSLLTVSSGVGVTILGSGLNSSKITQTAASTNVLSLSSPSGCAIRAMTVTGGGISASAATALIVDNVSISGGSVGLALSGASSSLRVTESFITGTTIGMSLADLTGGYVTDTQLVAAGATAISLSGATSSVYFANVQPLAATGLAFVAGFTGTKVSVVDSPGFGTVPATAFDLSALSTDPLFCQRGNLVDSFLYSAAVGNTLTIKMSNGAFPILKAASGGAGAITVAAPTPTPVASAGGAPTLTVQFVNGAGGAVTWTMNAVFVLAGAVAVPTTDGHTIEMDFRWDYLTSKWRERSRSDTTT